ncbi:hypothetical protein BLA29_007057, partial [Euroglyphus maynei]
MLNSSGTISNQNFIIPDQIMPYMNAYSTHLNSDKLSTQSMVNVKPISNNDDVFIVHHQHHYPPMFMNPESVSGSSSSMTTSGSSQTSFKPVKKMHKTNNRKKSKKLQIVYIKVPLLNLMDGTATTKSPSSKHQTSMENDDYSDDN